MSEIPVHSTLVFEDKDSLARVKELFNIFESGGSEGASLYAKKEKLTAWSREVCDQFTQELYAADDHLVSVSFLFNGHMSTADMGKAFASLGAAQTLVTIHNNQVDETIRLYYIGKRKAGKAKIIEELIDSAPTVALAVALENEISKAAISALKAGADPDGTVMGRPFIEFATENEFNTLVKALLASGANPSARSPVIPWGACFIGGNTALHHAVGYSEWNIGNELLEASADPNIQDSDGFTPLHRALQHNNNHFICEQLIKACSDVNLKTNDGYTPLLLLLKNGNNHEQSKLRVVELLLEAGADVNATDGAGGNALWYGSGFAEVSKRLREAGLCEITVPDNLDLSQPFQPLRRAIAFSNRAMFDVYIEHAEKMTPEELTELLRDVAKHNSLEMVEGLLAAGADPAGGGELIKRPYYIAKMNKHKQMEQMLRQAAEGAIAHERAVFEEMKGRLEKVLELIVHYRQVEGDPTCYPSAVEQLKETQAELRPLCTPQLANRFDYELGLMRFFWYVSMKLSSRIEQLEYMLLNSNTMRIDRCDRHGAYSGEHEQ
jgi:ankyrin repeat protein